MPAIRPGSRVQCRPPLCSNKTTTMQQQEASGVSCEASSSVATTSAPDAASPATTVPDETVQRIVSAISKAVLALLKEACATTLLPPSLAVETRELLLCRGR
ncbi:Hypothetical predicted protein [Paramuricea clavata]|uniref:Uncharacterized protein n=1 Tax=Paramuricea clavata TaxID=317549 RepID=A0A6S7I334_PARCT|nr:Hypothetical predicted protein [Paramuricea clavata]